jgi:hypothetical protein
VEGPRKRVYGRRQEEMVYFIDLPEIKVEDWMLIVVSALQRTERL